MVTEIVDLDLGSNSSFKIITVDGDIRSRFIEFHLSYNGEVFNLQNKSVKCRYINGKTTEEVNLTINDRVNGVCTLEIPYRITSIVQNGKCELVISQSGEILSTIPFSVEVVKSLIESAIVESSSEFGALNNALWKVDRFDSRINDLSSQLDNIETKKLDKNGIVNMANMGQDVKEALIHGGQNVAVVGKNAVLKENIVNKQVSAGKTTFLKLNTSKNLFDGVNYIYGVKITGDQTYASLEADENCNVAVIPIIGGKTYSILVKESELELEYNGKKYFKYMTSPNLYTGAQSGIEVTLNSSKYGTALTLITTERDKYIYVYISNTNNIDKLIQVVEGTQTEISITNYEECYNAKFEIKNKFISPLEGKIWVFLGDSITFGIGCSEGHNYPTLIKNKYGVNVINGAIAGGRYAKVHGSEANDYVIAQQIINQAEYIKKADIVSIKCGTNDFANVVGFGDADSTSEFTFNGGINNAISAIYSLNPKIRIVLFTPIYRATQSYTDDKNSDDFPLGGKYLHEYCTEIEKAGKRHHVPVFNLNDISGINRYNANVMLSDKLHLSDAGSEFLAPTIHGCVATLF